MIIPFARQPCAAGSLRSARPESDGGA